MLFDTASDTGKGWTADTGDRRWHGVNANAGTVTAGAVGTEGTGVVEAPTGMVANKWDTIEVELVSGLDGSGDTGGYANFFLNGKGVGRIDSPVASTARLTPIVSLGGHVTLATHHSMQLDYIGAWGQRDTGD